jgi:hypothetical protein
VLPTVASFTRVCDYDRPGTKRDDGALSPSTLVPQPTTAQAGVSDLQAVLSAAGEHGPYVLVGASWDDRCFVRAHRFSQSPVWSPWTECRSSSGTR